MGGGGGSQRLSGRKCCLEMFAHEKPAPKMQVCWNAPVSRHTTPEVSLPSNQTRHGFPLGHKISVLWEFLEKKKLVSRLLSLHASEFHHNLLFLDVSCSSERHEPFAFCENVFHGNVPLHSWIHAVQHICFVDTVPFCFECDRLIHNDRNRGEDRHVPSALQWGICRVLQCTE